MARLDHVKCAVVVRALEELMVHCAASLLVPFALLRTFAAYMHRGMSSHVFLEQSAASVLAAWMLRRADASQHALDRVSPVCSCCREAHLRRLAVKIL